MQALVGEQLQHGSKKRMAWEESVSTGAMWHSWEAANLPVPNLRLSFPVAQSAVANFRAIANEVVAASEAGVSEADARTRMQHLEKLHPAEMAFLGMLATDAHVSRDRSSITMGTADVEQALFPLRLLGGTVTASVCPRCFPGTGALGVRDGSKGDGAAGLRPHPGNAQAAEFLLRFTWTVRCPELWAAVKCARAP